MGVDDGLALLLAHHLLGAGCAISTVAGNVPVEAATRNALLYRELLGRTADWPILQGAARASDGFVRDATDVHGTDGLGGATHGISTATLRTTEHARYALLFDAAPPQAGEITLIGIGPATNIPRLVAWYGPSAVKRIVLMAGSFFDLGNITPAAEFNAYVDPGALQATLNIGLPTLMVPLDVCRKVQLDRATMTTLAAAADTDLTRLLAASHLRYMDFYLEREGINGCFPHDAITILAALEPERFFRIRGHVTVSTHADTRGHVEITPDATSSVEIVTGGQLKWVRRMIRTCLEAD